MKHNFLEIITYCILECLTTYHIPIQQVIPNTGLGIVHGNEAKPHSRPYQVRLEAEYFFFNQYCSGCLVTTKDVITTARCVFG